MALEPPEDQQPRDAPRIALISLEPWDQIWRRNQHLAAQLTSQGLARSIVFVNPPARGWRQRRQTPQPGITVVQAPLLVPRRFGGLRLAGLVLRLTALRGTDILWINDAPLGVRCLGRRPAFYDVTDDWRHTRQAPRVRRRLIAAEDRLARQAATIVCSRTLAQRWRERYGVDAPVVQNAAPSRRSSVAAVTLSGEAPHVGYVGTLQEERLDVELTLAIANSSRVGTVHLTGPDVLSTEMREALSAHAKIRIEPAVPAEAVPAYLAALDVLIAPHLVTDFTLSLDAIKAFEYLSTDRPVVATPTSGFQDLTAPGLDVAPDTEFVRAVEQALGRAERFSDRSVPTWADRAREFAQVMPRVPSRDPAAGRRMAGNSKR